MTDRSLTQGWPDDWNAGRYPAREAQHGVDPFGLATANPHGAMNGRTARPDTGRLDTGRLGTGDTGRAIAVGRSTAGETADETGFLGALFDFGFTSFMTPRIIKVLYVLLMIGTVVSALAFTIVVFKVSAAFGIVTLFFGDPLVILIVMAMYRIFLEFFVVAFRVAEDIQILRERGDLG